MTKVIEVHAGRPLTPAETFEITRTREDRLSRLLVLYITTGLVFMLLPETFLGVWNLLAISSRHAANSVSTGWIQAHGHAQIFGWVGTFILGIVDRGLPGHDGVLRWAENSPGIFRDAAAIQQQANVPFTAAAGNRLPASCQL